MASATQKMKVAKPVKHSVCFKARSKDKHPLFTGVYLMREAAKKLLGVKDLDDVEEIEVTVKVSGGNSSDEEDEEEED